MSPSMTIIDILTKNKINVPTYQRAYSWDTEFETNKPPKQVNQFILDLEEHSKSNTSSKYYFGHFLFKQKDNGWFDIIDGQQRITTIVIFLLSLCFYLEKNGKLDDKYTEYRDEVRDLFKTVDYDLTAFRDYIFDGGAGEVDIESLRTESQKRFVIAFRFFQNYFEKQSDDKDLVKLFEVIKEASCSTHTVQDESEAIQMFIFQNNRGKKPTNLEIIKAKLMFYIDLYSNDELKNDVINLVKERFRFIYEAISCIEKYASEDDVLRYSIRSYSNSLWEDNPQEWIDRKLKEDNPLCFIKEFIKCLSYDFQYLRQFFEKDKNSSIAFHSFIFLGKTGVVMPFILKAYQCSLPKEEKEKLCSALESIILRDRVIGTRADLRSRLNEVFQNFKNDIRDIIDKVYYLKNTEDNWWSYWNNTNLEMSLNNNVSHNLAKILLWKYEHHLERLGNKGYKETRFDKIEMPELEHIAPVKPRDELISTGYPEYNDDFVNNYLNCLGNFLLISKSHNGSLGNKPFEEKRKRYNELAQQREIVEMTKNKQEWTVELIKERHKKIVDFLLSVL